MIHSCPLCHHTGLTQIHHTQRTNRTFFACGQCALVSVPREQHVALDYEKGRYLQHNNTIENEGYVKMFMGGLDIVKRDCPGVKTVLDFGCGYEPVLQTLLQREGYAASIYDPFFFPDLPDGNFDLVISTEAFEHFVDVAAELKTITERVSPGGYLAVMTRLYTPAIDFATWWYHKDDTHIAFFRPTTFEYLADVYGYRVLSSDDLGFTVLQRI